MPLSILGDSHDSNSTHSYLPVMINRLILSLKKAADTSEAGWSLRSVARPSEQPPQLVFAQFSDEGSVSFADEDTPPGSCSAYGACAGNRGAQTAPVTP